MRFRIQALAPLALFGATLALAGCAGANSQAASALPVAGGVQSSSHVLPAPSSLVLALRSGRRDTHGWMTPDAKKPGDIYVADARCSCIMVYNLRARADRKPVGEIAGGALVFPQGLSTDRKGNLWVANYNGGNVLLYPPGATAPSKTLEDPGFCSGGVVVGRDGTVYVANLFVCPGSSGSGNVAIYANGATAPTRVLTEPSFEEVYGLAVDRSRDIFLTNYVDTGSGSSVAGEFKAGPHGSYAYTQLVSGPGSLFAGIALDRSGNLLVSSAFFPTTPGINVYSPPGWSLTNQFGHANAWLSSVALSHDGTKAFVADLEDDGGPPAVYEYAYPSGTQLSVITAGLQGPIAVAVAPEAPIAP
jgi:hypothetical protein